MAENSNSTNAATSKEVVTEMMRNEDFVQFFKTLVKDAVKEENSEYRQRVLDLEQQVNDLKTSNEELKGDIHDLQVSKTKLEKKTKGIKKQANELQTELTSKSSVLEDLQQYSRRNCLIITGVPERVNEKTDDVVKDLAKEIGVTVNDIDIDRSHRLGAPNTGKNRPLIVKMTRYNKRLELIKSRRKLKGRNIGIQESLTEYKQYLLKKAQELVKRCEIAKSTWTWDGALLCTCAETRQCTKEKGNYQRL